MPFPHLMTADENRANAELIVKAVNEHAALVAVAEAAIKEVSVHPGTEPRGHAEWECRICGVRSAIKAALSERDFHHGHCALAVLAAVRAGQPVAAVKYEEAVFNTKEDADFWIAQERRKDGFHVIETVKAGAGLKVVFERRNGGAK